MAAAQAPPLREPAVRRLRVYAFDPNASLDLGSARFSHATIALPWNDPTDGELQVGPINDYLEVVDVDPSSDTYYPPLDLNAPEVLAEQGLTPSEGDPRFHQQMVFAVVMKTIKLFERALGRRVLWAQEWSQRRKTYVPTPRLRIYPHALREPNAFYSRGKRALLFGYFNASQRSAGASWIFTALSHDIIVHETTHAILDGLHPRYAEGTSIDSLAFHEAFADIAALFSHFQLYEAVYDFIDRNGGNLGQVSLLTGLAAQFAKGSTGRSVLREFLEKEPDPNRLESTTECHERGSILVAAVFDAFLSIYKARTADLLRLSGVTPGAGAHLHPDLTARLTKEATKSADHVLRMCIRALDYLPPVDVNFGEFLRAIITADTDLIPDDRLNYRLAFVQAFRARGIFPEHCLSMSPDNLLWDQPIAGEKDPDYLDTTDIQSSDLNLVPEFNRDRITTIAESNRRKIWYWLVQPQFEIIRSTRAQRQQFQAFLSAARNIFAGGAAAGPTRARALLLVEENKDYFLEELGFTEALLEQLRSDLRDAKDHFAMWIAFVSTLSEDGLKLQRIVSLDRAWERALGIYFATPSTLKSIPAKLSGRKGVRSSPSVEVASVRLTRRAGPDGQDLRQLVIEVTQRRRGYFDPARQSREDGAGDVVEREDFTFRGGATMIIDLREGKLRYVISKSISDEGRLQRQRAYLQRSDDLGFTYDARRADEPFAMVHRQ